MRLHLDGAPIDTATDGLFDPTVWTPALQSYGAVTQLTVALYDAQGSLVCGPVPDTPFITLFRDHGYDPGLFADCAQACLAQTSGQRTPVIVSRSSCLAVVGVSLVLHERVVAAVVAGYSMIGFAESVAIGRLARECGAPFQTVWALARRQTPVSAGRLKLHGELLRILGDTVLRENDLRRQSELTAVQLSHLAHHDSLTDLPNRALLADRLARALALATRHQRMLAVLFLDLDGFKHINDSLGHPLGDELLRAVARALTACVRKSDTVGRQSGDEFIVLLPEIAQAEAAAAVARTVIAAVAQPHQLDGTEVRVFASIGISVFPTDGDEAETLMKHADMAMYEAKELGGGHYQFFQPDLNRRAVERRALEAGLYRALADHEFELFYQPKVQLETGAIIGAEALIRWRHPDRGLVLPAEFVPIAEACGLIGPIGGWVLQEACRQAKAWHDAGLRAIPVAVNVSAVEFGRDDLLTNVVASLQTTGLDPRLLELELTESVLTTRVSASAATFGALKQLGVQMTIDDFGTGRSSLSDLAQLPIDALKIDRSFVQQIRAKTQAAPIVSAVISMARNLDLRVIAEGIETRDQLTFLQGEACVEGQGYYFGRPVAAEQFARVLEMGVAPA
ncbi:MAG: EAL domain-containing protein [Acidobacteriota bacterium]